MTRGCLLCQRAPAKKAPCCGQKLCDEHRASSAAHSCPRQAELRAITSDPKRRKEWLRENAPEEAVTTAALRALNTLPGVSVWRTKRRQGPRKSDELDGVLDVTGYAAPEGIALFVETKREHKDDCLCSTCAAQRDFAARAAAAGCVVVTGVRTVQAAVDAVRLGLARARAKRGDAA